MDAGDCRKSRITQTGIKIDLKVRCGANGGDRQTVVGRGGSVSAGLEFGRFFDVPHRESIKRSASYGS